MKTFDTVAALKLANLKEGQFTSTHGYYTKKGVGGAQYLIKTAAEASSDSDVIDGFGNVTIANGNVAILHTTFDLDGMVFGVLGDGATDDGARLQAASDHNSSSVKLDTTLTYNVSVPVTGVFYAVGVTSNNGAGSITITNILL